MKKIFLLFVFISTYTIACCQVRNEPAVDSLQQLLTNKKPDTSRVKLLYAIADAYAASDPTSCLKYVDSGLAKSKSLQYAYGIGAGYDRLGIYYSEHSQSQIAMDYFMKARAVFAKTGDLRSEASILNNIGNVYHACGNDSMALKFHKEAIAINQAIHDSSTLAAGFLNMGNTLVGKDVYSALPWYHKALALYSLLKDEEHVAAANTCLGNVFVELGALDSGYQYLYAAHLLYGNQYNKYGIMLTAYNISTLYLSVLDSIEHGKVVHFSPPKENVTDSRDYTVAIRKRMLRTTIDRLLGCKEIAEELGDKGILEHIIGRLALAYGMQQDYKKAFIYQQQYNMLRDSLAPSHDNSRLVQMEMQYNFDKARFEDSVRTALTDKEHKANLARQNMYNIGSVAGTVILLILMIVLYRGYALQKKYNALLKQQEEHHIARIREQNDILTDIAFTQNHHVRGPLSTLLGLTRIINRDDPTDPENKEILDGIVAVAERLDIIVHDIVDKRNKLKGPPTDRA